MQGQDDENVVLGKVCSTSARTGYSGERYVFDIFSKQFEWPLRPLTGKDDRAIDAEVTIPRGERRLDTGVLFYVQVKATAVDVDDSRDYVSHDCDLNDLALWIGRAVHAPVLLVLYSTQQSRAYWVDVLSAVHERRDYSGLVRVCLNLGPTTQKSVALRIPLTNVLADSHDAIRSFVLGTYRELRKDVLKRPAALAGPTADLADARHGRQHNLATLFARVPFTHQALVTLVLGEQSAAALTSLMKLIRGVSHALAASLIRDAEVEIHLWNAIELASDNRDYLSVLSLISVVGQVSPAQGMDFATRASSLVLPTAIISSIFAVYASLESVQGVLSESTNPALGSRPMPPVPPVIETSVAASRSNVAHVVTFARDSRVIVNSPELVWDCTCDLEGAFGTDPREIEARCPIHQQPAGAIVGTLYGSPCHVSFRGVTVLAFSGPVWPPAMDTFVFIEALEQTIASLRSSWMPRVFIDAGCGTGIIGVYARARICPDARLIYFDSSAEALAIARYNHLVAFGSLDNTEFVRGTSLASVRDSVSPEDVDHCFLACTPPYLPYPPGSEGHRLRKITHSGVAGLDLLRDVIGGWNRLARHIQVSMSTLVLPCLTSRERRQVDDLRIVSETRTPLRVPLVTHRAELREWLTEHCGLYTEPVGPYHYWHTVRVLAS